MSARSDNSEWIPFRVDIHPSPMNPKIRLASISGLDVAEAIDGYTPSELRSIARYLDNIAEDLDYSNSHANVPPLFDTV